MLPSQPSAYSVLVADDEPIVRRTVVDALVDRGYATFDVADGNAALDRLERGNFDVVVTDLKMPGANGLEVLRAARRFSPSCAVIVMTAHGTIQTAIQAVRDGAFQYLTKPFELDELLLQVDRACAQRGLILELERARQTLGQLGSSQHVVARSAAMSRAMSMAQAVAKTEASVLLLGETGAGKEVVAKAIHQWSSRSGQALVALNCSAVPEALFEAELFGVARGAFTGADVARDGRFLAAHRGTLFLDEIGDLPLGMQAKLLRALEEGTVERLGSNVPIPVNVRIIAATHRDLRSMVAAGRFRDDLYFRLNVITIQIPPLRERADDIPTLVAKFSELMATTLGHPAPTFTAEALEALCRYPWPGNVRELKNAVMRSMVLVGPSGAVEPWNLPTEVFERGPNVGGELVKQREPTPRAVRRLEDVVAEAEKRALEEAIRATGGNRSEAARLLGISRKQLWQKSKQYGV